MKPLFTIYREETVIKAIAALNFLGPQGIGYLLVDASGRTPATSSPPPHHNFDALPRIRSERPVFDARHPELARTGW